MSSTNLFHIRHAASSPNDAQFLLDALDSAIPHLAATGNTGQWGTQLFSERPGLVQETKDEVAQSENFRQTGQGEPQRVFVAEIVDEGDVDKDHKLSRRTEAGTTYLAVAGMILHNHFSQYLINSDELKPVVPEAIKVDNFVFVKLLIADHRVDHRQRRGVGLALINKAKQYALENGKSTLWLDCWAGGDGKLPRYVSRTFDFIVAASLTVPATTRAWGLFQQGTSALRRKMVLFGLAGSFAWTWSKKVRK